MSQSRQLHSPIIIGAGPAGVRAAETLVKYGLHPTVIDEAPRAGGQIYRQQPVNFTRTKQDLYGFEASRADAIHQTFEQLLPHVDYYPQHLVWHAQPQLIDVYNYNTQTSYSLPWQDMIVATGATDRVLPFKGWTTPGVYTLGGAQVALKFQGCAIGENVVFAGTGPLLYLVAYQYKKAGANVVAILDYASLQDQIKAMPSMLRIPSVFLKGLYYVSWLKMHGVPIHNQAELVGAEGNEHVERIIWRSRKNNKVHTLSCQALGFGYALRSETQLADLLGCEFEFHPLHRAHLPKKDTDGRSSVAGVYLAGDSAGIMGADAAEAAGELAALALLKDRQITVDEARVTQLQHKLNHIYHFREGLEKAFPFPGDWAKNVADDVVICRCEHITVGELRFSVTQTQADDLNRTKALTRVGMGRCQGRMCGVAAAEIIAQARGESIEHAGRIRGQSPVKPIPIAIKVIQEADHATH